MRVKVVLIFCLLFETGRDVATVQGSRQATRVHHRKPDDNITCGCVAYSIMYCTVICLAAPRIYNKFTRTFAADWGDDD